MKILQILSFFIILNSCESKGQEKVYKLSIDDQKLISEATKDQNFELYSIKKIDSSQNEKNVSYYDSDFVLNRKEFYKYDENNRLDVVREYNSTNSKDKEYLTLFSEKTHTYSKGYEKIVTKVWRGGKEIGSDVIEKTFNEENKLLKTISKSTFIDSQKTSTLIQIYKYTFNKLQNTETICVEEYREFTVPKSFEECSTYLYRNGKITQNEVGNVYLYDSKNRLINEVRFNKKREPYFEDLYIYNDQEKSMEHQRYRFNGSKFLVAKDETFYNVNGSIQKIIHSGMSEDNTLIPKDAILKFYDKNNKEKMIIELKSKKFIEKLAQPTKQRKVSMPEQF